MDSSMYCVLALNKRRGITLVELMVTIAIAAILMAVAAPAMTSFLLQGRISAHVNDLVGAINLARSEAVKRGGGVTICRSSDQASCSTATTGWEVGWIVFADPNLNATVDAGETIIHVFPALPNGSTAVANSGMTTGITFAGNGRPGATFSGALMTICPSTTSVGTSTSYCRYICINAQGRPRVDTPTAYATDTICGN